MLEPIYPANEKERVRALRNFDVVNTDPEKEYDEIVRLVAHICNIGTAHISLIDTEKQWIKAKVGMGVQNLDRKLAFCAHTILEEDVFIVSDATKDQRFFDHPMVLDDSVRFYAGMPLTTSEGYNIGSLCVIDNKPRKLDENQINALRIISKQVIRQLELRKANKTLRIQGKELLEINDLNQKLLFMIGHDVRTPLASLKGLLSLFERGALTTNELQSMVSTLNATLTSTDSLLNDLLQWSAAQQHQLEQEPFDISLMVDSLLINNRVEFLRKKNNVINLIPPGTTIAFDRNVLTFVLRNLILNANKFTDAGNITVESAKQHSDLRLSVQDSGRGMDAEQIKKLFNWEVRHTTAGTQGEKGSGLALLLSNDLLKKKGADLLVESSSGKGSLFSVVIPGNKNGL